MTPIQTTTAQSSGATSVTASLAGVTAGHSLHAGVGFNDTSLGVGVINTPAGFTSDQNATIVPGLSIGGGLFHADNQTSGSHSVTFNSLGGGASLYATVALEEWNWQNPSIDQSAGPGTSQGFSTTSASTPNITPTSAASTVKSLIAIGCGSGFTNAGISDPPAGFTKLAVSQNTSSANGTEICYKDAGSTSAQNTTWAFSADPTQVGSVQLTANYLQSGAVAPAKHFLGTLGAGG